MKEAEEAQAVEKIGWRYDKSVLQWERRSQLNALLCMLAVLAFLAWLFFMPACILRAGPKMKLAELKQNTHAVSLALERYGADSHCYPADLSPIVTEAYLPSLPGNPYSGRQRSKMRALRPGDPASPGDFVYIPLSAVEATEGILGYQIYVYGEKKLPGWKRFTDLPSGIDPRYAAFAVRQLSLGSEPEFYTPQHQPKRK